MSTDRFFRWLMGGVVWLAALALAVALTRQQQARYRPEVTPQAVAYNFLLALHRGDWEKAYDLLGNAPCKPERTNFEMTFQNWRSLPDVAIKSVRQQGTQAWVTLQFYYDASPFGDLENERETMPMILRYEGGHWKIIQVPPPIWPFPPLERKPCPERPPYGGY